MHYEWDWSGAERELKRAVAPEPNCVNAHYWYSHYLILMGRFDESLAESRRALALDPLDVGMNFHLGFHYFNARQYNQAVAQLQKALEMDRNHSGAHGVHPDLNSGYDEKACASSEIEIVQLTPFLGRG